MPYVRPFIKVAAKGVFGTAATTPLEQWSAGFHVGLPASVAVSPAQVTTYLAALSGPIGTFHANTNLRAGTLAWLTDLTGAYIGTDGKYVLGGLQPTSTYHYAAAVAGNSPTVNPYPTAMVITLRSPILRGPASHGRMYWPATGLSISSNTGTISAGLQDGIATAAQVLFNAINSAAVAIWGTGTNAALVSNVRTGAEAFVSSVGAGARLDHMESRERSIPEAHIMKTLTVTAALLAEREERYLDELEDLRDGLGEPR